MGKRASRAEGKEIRGEDRIMERARQQELERGFEWWANHEDYRTSSCGGRGDQGTSSDFELCDKNVILREPRGPRGLSHVLIGTVGRQPRVPSARGKGSDSSWQMGTSFSSS